MKSAAAYTNKRRVMAEAGNTKVEQIGNIATNYGPLQPVLPSTSSIKCGPDFTRYSYFKGCPNLKHSICVIPIPLSFWITTPNVNLVSDSSVTKTGGSNTALDEGIFTTSAYTNFTVTFKVASIKETTVALGYVPQLFGNNRDSRRVNARYAMLIHESLGGFVECYSAFEDSSYGASNFTVNSVLKITATSTLISFYKDNTLLHSFNRENNSPLYVNISLYRLGSSVTDITITPN